MAKKPEEIAPVKAAMRESDNPIVEEYKEEMLHRPGFGAQPNLESEERLCHLEGLLAELIEKVESLESRLKALEGRP